MLKMKADLCVFACHIFDHTMFRSRAIVNHYITPCGILTFCLVLISVDVFLLFYFSKAVFFWNL